VDVEEKTSILDKLGMPPFKITHHKCTDGKIKEYPSLLCSKCGREGIDLCLSRGE
jgi:uncharacterized OB-fold protein